MEAALAIIVNGVPHLGVCHYAHSRHIQPGGDEEVSNSACVWLAPSLKEMSGLRIPMEGERLCRDRPMALWQGAGA